MRFFTYISDAKVDMLVPQIPWVAKKKIATEIGVNLGFLNAKVASETVTHETRVARLNVVERYIRNHEPVGSVETPGKWAEGRLAMQSVDIGEGCLLYLAAGDSWIVALAGAAKHLSGGAAPEGVAVPFSFLPSIASHLSMIAVRRPELLDNISERGNPDFLAIGVNQGIQAWYQTIAWCAGKAEGRPSQNLGFLGKRLAAEEYAGRKITLVSPLYIELLD